MTARSGGSRARAPRDPYGIGPVTGIVGPVLAIVGLVVIAVLTFNLFNGQLPFVAGGGGPGTGGNGGGNGGGPAITPAPSNEVIVAPEVTFKGTIAYAKAGNIWLQTGTEVHQLTNGGADSMPAFSPDGQWVYFVRTTEGRGKFPAGGNGGRAWYDLETPALMRVKPDGSGLQRLLNGRYQTGNNAWFYWMREPTPTPDGKAVLLITDGPNPMQSDIVVKRFDLASKQLTSLNLPKSGSLGHQDPAWRPDGNMLLYVRNGRDGAKGAPQIFRYDPKTKRSGPVTGPGYLSPAYSPDGRYIAATKTDSFGTDVAILDASGKELLRVTNDHHSFSPVWSPAGDAVAFLHLEGTIVDLRMATLDASSGNWLVTKTIDLTKVSGLDGASRPSWFTPSSELPAPSGVPGSSGSAAPAAPAASSPPGSASTAP
jgi:Tol biopolymer transport system component